MPYRAGSHCDRRVWINLSGAGPDRRLSAVRELVGVGGVVASLSVTSDLTRGHPPGEAMRACLLATELARRAGLDPIRQSEVYYGTLLRFVGCAATSHEIAGRRRLGGRRPDRSLPGGSAGPAGSGVAGGWRGRGCADRGGLAARFAAVGFTAVMFESVGGVKVAAQTVAQWSGRALDPAVTAVFLDAPDELLRICDPDDLQAAAVDCEPQPRRVFRDDAALDDALAGFGDAADLKSPWFTGHSGGVARLAMAAAGQLDQAVAGLVHRAGLVHDIGRVTVPTGIWERPGALRPEDWELVRLHPYHSGRILARSPVLAPLGEIACRHHERADGSGYPAGMRGSELDAAACVLAAADVFHALGEQRPHRPAIGRAEAAKVLAGLPLDRDAVRAVLAAADAPAAALPRLPAGLTERELDVLRLLAAGRTKREIASDLVISPSTVHTHTVHIYAKCGVSTRAALAMFAMRHGLAARADRAGSGQASRP